jgi:D-arginine dehydrogenase
MDVAALHQGFLRGSQLIRSARLTAAARTAGRWRLTTTAGELTATTLVNAAGAWADEVATIAGAPPLGLMPLRRSMAVLRLDTAPPADLPVTMDAHETFYFKPDGERLWLSPADETPDMPRDVRPDEMDLATVIDRFEGVWAGQVRRLEHSWAGLRTFAPDRLPVYGWDAHVDGLFWCAGQGGFGIQTAPAAGEMAAALLLGEMPAVAAEAYGPGRFG